MQKKYSTRNLVESINKIEHFLPKRSWILRQEQMTEEVVNTKPLKVYVVPTNEESHYIIFHLPIGLNNFEIKPCLLGMIHKNRFLRLLTENPNLHLFIFVKIGGMLNSNSVNQNIIRLNLFPLSLRDRSWAWIQSLSPNSIITCAKWKDAFLTWYFSMSKITQVRSEIIKFKKKEWEWLFDAYDHFKDLWRLYPLHGIRKWLIVHTFYNDILYSTRMTRDAEVDGTLMNYLENVAYNLIEDMEKNQHSWGSVQEIVVKAMPKTGGLYEVVSTSL